MKHSFKNTVLLVLLQLAFGQFTQAQMGFDNNLNHFSNTTDYLNINRENFVVSNTGSDFANYHYSVLKLGTELATFAGNEGIYKSLPYDKGTVKTDILGKFDAYRIEYTEPISFGINGILGKTRLRAIIVKSKETPDNAPCVLLATGNTGKINDFGSSFIVNLTDLLMRGYVVMFYETTGSNRILSNNTPITEYVKILFLNVPPKVQISTSEHLLFLQGEAAAKYMASSIGVNTFKIDVNKIFTMGFSNGSAVSSVTLFGNKGYFQNILSPPLKIMPNNSFVIKNPIIENTNYAIQGGIMMGGTIFKTGTINMSKDILSNDVSSKRALYIYGVDDTAAHPEKGDETFEGKEKLSIRLTKANVKHFISPICNAEHTLYRPIDIGGYFSSLPMENLLNIVKSTTTSNLYNKINGNLVLNGELSTFKEINTQAFQVGSTTAKFIQNTILGTTTVMGVTDKFQYVKCVSKKSQPFKEANWQFSTITDCNILLKTDVKQYNSGDILIFPNPTSDFLTIKSQNELKTIQVFDITGQIIYQIPANGNYEAIIDLSTQPKGVYFISMDGTIEKIVKM